MKLLNILKSEYLSCCLSTKSSLVQKRSGLLLCNSSPPDGYINKINCYLLKELIEHPVIDIFRSCTVELGDLFCVRTVRVESTELTARISEQHEEMFALGARDFFQHPSFSFRVHRPGEHAVFDSVQHYPAIGLRRRLLVQSWTCSRSFILVLQ